MRRFPILVAGLVCALLLLPSPAAGTAQTGFTFGVASARLSGAQEVPPADPDGSGLFGGFLVSGVDRLCYFLIVRNIDPSTVAHIHKAPAGTNGPIVIDLEAPTSGRSGGCASPRATAPSGTIQDIIDNPEGYYVNVHNAPFPGGAVRGQLG